MATVARFNVPIAGRFQPMAERFDSSVRFVGPMLTPAAPFEDEALMSELGEGTLVYVSLGTLFNEQPGFYRTVFEALGGGGDRVLISIGPRTDPAALGAVPGNVVLRPFVPQLDVLERADVFLSHAGMNSASESLAAGVPLVLWPQQPEQGIVARRVRDLGAGVLLGKRSSAGEIRDAVATARGPSHRAAAREIADSFRAAGGRAVAADEIEDVLAQANVCSPP